jgi:quercetin dioxygenase-like cupin family protein
MNNRLIEHAETLPRETPAGHAGTLNIKLVDREFCGRFEMLRGIVQPGGEAEPHQHETEHQVIYVIAGEIEVTLGDEHPVRCRPGSIIRIPPRLTHRVVNIGDADFEAIIIYSPPSVVHQNRPADPD